MRLSTLSRISQRFISVNQVCLISASGAWRNQLFSLLLSAVFSFFLNGFNPLAISDNFFAGRRVPIFPVSVWRALFHRLLSPIPERFRREGRSGYLMLRAAKKPAVRPKAALGMRLSAERVPAFRRHFLNREALGQALFQGDDLSVRAVRIFSLLRFDGGFFHIIFCRICQPGIGAGSAGGQPGFSCGH